MIQKIEFTPANKKELKRFIIENKKDKKIFNFLNLYSIYLYKKDKEFREAIDKMKIRSINLADGSTISVYFRIKRVRGTDFTNFFMEDKDLTKNKNHFFIGLSEKDLEILSNKFKLNRKTLFAYNPPYIKANRFSKEEIEKIIRLVKSKKINYLWIGVGNPKQEILAFDLYDKINVECIFNVGAALDFITEKKKESPKIIQRFGLEWLYRWITDFRYSNKKVFRSFLGLIYMLKIAKINKNNF
jgi:N-acetylglucosaminyldiphosphoundecaprenol N-acetyl-beta-D-mannosaminyltransferase